MTEEWRPWPRLCSSGWTPGGMQAVLALGATKTAEQPGVPDGNWRVYLDPAGHPFCLCWD